MAKKAKKAIPTFIDPTIGKGSTVMPLDHIAAIIQAKICLDKSEINSEPEVEWSLTSVYPSELNVDFIYQRFIQTNRIKSRAANWKPSSATPLICVWRTDLSAWRIVDGLQRGNMKTLLNGKKKIQIVYIEVDNIEQEFDMFLTINTENDKIEDADIHKIKVQLGIKASVDLDKAVRAAGFFIARPGTTDKNALTHFGHTETCFTKYGKKLTTILKRARMVYTDEKLDGAVIYALLILQEKLRSSGKYTKTLFDDILISTKTHFGTQAQLKKAADRSFRGDDVLLKRGDDEVKLNAPFKIASTIISSYNEVKNKNLCTKLYNDLVIYLIDKKKFPNLHPTFNAATYGTREIYEEVSETGDLKLPWAYSAAKRYDVDFDGMHDLCADNCNVCSEPLDYGLGSNMNKAKADVNTPQVGHKHAQANGGKDKLDNFKIICKRCNLIESNSTSDDRHRYKIIGETLPIAVK